jgi:hypothetical protein
MLLDYALLSAPTTLQAGMPATLTLAISNSGRRPVTVTRIEITLLIGPYPKDLTASAGFETDKMSGWDIKSDGGILTLTPEAGTGPVLKDAVVVTISNVAVNDQPGTTSIAIDETAAVGGGAPATSSTSLPVAKFPVQFSLSDLVVTPPEVAFGGDASVMWSGTQADQATYMLQYPGVAPFKVSNVGPYPASNLTIFPAVFTLTVSLTVPGQDQPLIVQKQAVVEEKPQLAISQFAGSQPVMSGGTPPLVLQWQTQLATSLTLQLAELPGAVDVNGLSGCTVSAYGSPPLVISDASGKKVGTLTPPSPFPQFLNFMLTASDGTSFVQRSVLVEVLAPSAQSSWYLRVWPHGEGRTYFLNWSTANGNPVTISNIGNVGASGTTSVNYGVTYTVSAVGFGATGTSQTTPG